MEVSSHGFYFKGMNIGFVWSLRKTTKVFMVAVVQPKSEPGTF
jgi:hypothetical protein